MVCTEMYVIAYRGNCSDHIQLRLILSLLLIERYSLAETDVCMLVIWTLEKCCIRYDSIYLPSARFILAKVTRDTGIIPLLVHMDDTILCCSSNGAIRIFNLMHNVKRIQLKLTMWEHAKRVTHILLGDRSIGNCERHGVENHICHIYTASEDRSIRVWDMNSNLPIKTVKSRMIRRHTVQCLTKSNRHLMAGTTGGTVSCVKCLIFE